MKEAKYTGLDVAGFVISYTNEKNLSITNLKLQKVLFYIEAAFLKILEYPCFKDEIKAWKYGPVLPVVYREFKRFGTGQITSYDYQIKKDYTDKEREILIQVIEKYTRMNAWELVKLTHEQAWDEEKYQRQEVITKEEIKKFYKDVEII